MDEKLKELESAINGHDFYYMMSDDHRWWLAGERSMARIRELAREVPKDEANALWEKRFGDYELYAPLIS